MSLISYISEYHYGNDRVDNTRGVRSNSGAVGTLGVPKPLSKDSEAVVDAIKKLKKKKSNSDEPETELDAKNEDIDESFRSLKKDLAEINNSPRGAPSNNTIGSSPTTVKINNTIGKLTQQKTKDIEQFGQEEADRRFEQSLKKMGVRYK
jgi:hypothetical protein